MTTVLICEDQPDLRAALHYRLTGIPGITKVVSCANGQELLDGYAAAAPDLVLLDSRLSERSGLDMIRRLLHQHPEAHVLMLTGRSDRDQAAAAVAAGARGFLAKEGSRTGFATAVVGALAGRDLAGPPRRPRVPEARSAADDAPSLTERELQVLHGMANGQSNAEIGRSLFLSEDTIKTHARRLFRKLGVGDRAQAVALGFRAGLVS